MKTPAPSPRSPIPCPVAHALGLPRCCALFLFFLLLTSSLWPLTSTLADDLRWIAAAQDIPQITTITIADTWAAADKATVTCNNKSITVTCGATMDTPAEVAAGVAEALALNHHVTAQLTADMTINAGGREFGEFWDFDATVSGAVVTLTSRVAGVPYTVTTSETTAGDGTVGTPSTTQAATGKNWFDQGANWSGGSVPTDGDTIIFDNGAVSILYGLGNTAEYVAIYRTDDYTGSIGLPLLNASVNGLIYSEYRARYLDLPSGNADSATHTIGTPNSNQRVAGEMWIDFSDTDPTLLKLMVYNTAGLHLAGGHDIQLVASGGSIDIGEDAKGTASTLKSLRVSGSADVRIMSNAIFNTSSSPTVQLGGTLTVDCGSTGNTADFYLYGGTTLLNAATATFDDLYVYGGARCINNGTVTDTFIFGGGVLGSGNNACTLTNVSVYSGASILDGTGSFTFTNGIDFVGCQPKDVTLVTPASQTWTPSSL